MCHIQILLQYHISLVGYTCYSHVYITKCIRQSIYDHRVFQFSIPKLDAISHMDCMHRLTHGLLPPSNNNVGIPTPNRLVSHYNCPVLLRISYKNQLYTKSIVPTYLQLLEEYHLMIQHLPQSRPTYHAHHRGWDIVWYLRVHCRLTSWVLPLTGHQNLWHTIIH